MSDENKKDLELTPQQEYFEAHKEEMANKGNLKLAAIKAVKALGNKGSKWNLVEEMMQEILATKIISNPELLEKPPISETLEDLKKEIEIRYDKEEETKELLLSAIPSKVTAAKWFKKEGWEQAVWDKVRGSGLFGPERRAKMINSIYNRGLNKSDNAAKLWLQLSGDLVENKTMDNKTIETFREINEILHKKK
jgi:hypothetical protein